MKELSDRLQHVRVQNAEWDRCMNTHYGTSSSAGTAIFMDPPYLSFEKNYRESRPVAIEAATWAAEHASERVKIAICGHDGDYDSILPTWTKLNWSRGRLTYGSKKTTDKECIWFSPACEP
jgi:site-specific DNA-adenine methylase